METSPRIRRFLALTRYIYIELPPLSTFAAFKIFAGRQEIHGNPPQTRPPWPSLIARKSLFAVPSQACLFKYKGYKWQRMSWE